MTATNPHEWKTDGWTDAQKANPPVRRQPDVRRQTCELPWRDPVGPLFMSEGMLWHAGSIILFLFICRGANLTPRALNSRCRVNFLINDNLSLLSQVYHMILATSPIIHTGLTVILTSLIDQPKCQDPAEDQIWRFISREEETSRYESDAECSWLSVRSTDRQTDR